MGYMDIDVFTTNRSSKTGRTIKYISVRNIVVPKFSNFSLWAYYVDEIGHCQEDRFVTLMIGDITFQCSNVFVNILVEYVLSSSWIARAC